MPNLLHIVETLERSVDGIGSCTQPFSVVADTRGDANVGGFKPAVAAAHPDAGRDAWPACHGRWAADGFSSTRPPLAGLAAFENRGLGLRLVDDAEAFDEGKSRDETRSCCHFG